MSEAVATVEPAVQGILMQGELSVKEVVERRRKIQNMQAQSKAYLLDLREQDNWRKDPIVKQNDIKTIEEYFNIAFGYSKQHVYRLIQEQEVLVSIPDESLRPDNEGQARILATLQPAHREAAMRKAIELAPPPKNPKLPKKVTARQVEASANIIRAMYPDEYKPKVVEPEPVSQGGKAVLSDASIGKPQSDNPVDYTVSDADYKTMPKLLDIVKVKSRKDLFGFKFRYSDGSTQFEYYRSSVKGMVKQDTSVPNTMSRGEQIAADAAASLSAIDFPEGADPEIFDEDTSTDGVDPLAEVNMEGGDGNEGNTPA